MLLTEEKISNRDLRLVEVSDEEGVVFLANTTMTDEEIEHCINLEEEAFETFDYEERCEAWAEYISEYFERIYADKVLV